MNKVEELEERVKELEDTVLKLKRNFNAQIYELDENNFSRDFLRKLGYKLEVKTTGDGNDETT